MHKAFVSLSAATIMAFGILGISAPAHAAAPTPSCSSSPQAGDDYCTLQANAYTDLVGYESRDIDVLANDGPTVTDVCAVGPLDASLGNVYLNQDSSGHSDLAIFIEPSVTQVFSFRYTSCDGATHNVQVTPIPYVAPRPLKVTKVHRKGYVRTCNSNNVSLTFLYGSLKNDEPDGGKVIKAHSCRLVRVHRHTLDWFASSNADGSPAGSGTVHHIRLKKGDHAPATVQSYKRPIAGARLTWSSRS